MMIRKILFLLSQGNYTIAEIAQRANMSKEELLNRFEIMERMGYLEKSNNTVNNGRTCEPSKMCAFCPEAQRCSKMITLHQNGVSYHMTLKGKNVVDIS